MLSRLRPRLGLALGGGAARGLAHIGVLRVLQRAGLTVDFIAGTSMGAVLGGAYAASGDVDALDANVSRLLEGEPFRSNRLAFLREDRENRSGLFFSMTNLLRRGIFFGVSNVRPSFLSAEAFSGAMNAMLPDVDIEELKIPFGAVALDLDTADEVLIRRGSLRTAAAASAAIPGILPPILAHGRVLIDGGWVDKVPVLPAFLMGADVVVAVDIAANLEEVRNYRRGVDIMVRANSIKDAALVSFHRRLADLVIRPEVRDVHWADFGSARTCIAAGERAAEAVVPAIEGLLRKAGARSLWRRGHGRRLADALFELQETSIVEL